MQQQQQQQPHLYKIRRLHRASSSLSCSYVFALPFFFFCFSCLCNHLFLCVVCIVVCFWHAGLSRAVSLIRLLSLSSCLSLQISGPSYHFVISGSLCPNANSASRQFLSSLLAAPSHSPSRSHSLLIEPFRLTSAPADMCSSARARTLQLSHSLSLASFLSLHSTLIAASAMTTMPH